jgi:MazG family protein
MLDLTSIRSITDAVIAFPLRTPTLPPATHTNMYILGTSALTLIDVASPYVDEQDRLYKYLHMRMEQGAYIERIILTHHHQDHIAGVQALVDRYQVPVYAHPANHDLVKFTIDHELNDGEHINISLAETSSSFHQWEVMHTPGHTKGHICLVNHQLSIGIIGDMLASKGSILIHPVEGHMRTYIQQLQRLQSLDLAQLLPSHGLPIMRSDHLIQKYIQHRLMREQKILHALPFVSTSTHSITTPQNTSPEVNHIQLTHGKVSDTNSLGYSLKELVELAYDDAPAIVKKGKNGGLAGLSAEAHLIKLVEDGYAYHHIDQVSQTSVWRRSIADDCLAASMQLHPIQKLDQVMTTLRQKCSWDAKQTLQSLKRYLLEESYEVLDALNHEEDWQSHRDELGDLLLQIIFQSKIREEKDQFALNDVIGAIYEKMIRRHPHVFTHNVYLSEKEAATQWQKIKAEEKKRDGIKKPKGILDTVPKNIPALLHAQLLGEKAAHVGFEWPDLQGPLDKVMEEYHEVLEAIESGIDKEIIAEVGDLLFSIVNVCRHLKISPETALQHSSYVFYKRFSHIEKKLRQTNKRWEDVDLIQLEHYWQEAKELQSK